MACVNSSLLKRDPTSCSFFHSPLPSPVPFFWSSKSIEIFCALKHPSTHDQRRGRARRASEGTEKEDTANHTWRIEDRDRWFSVPQRSFRIRMILPPSHALVESECYPSYPRFCSMRLKAEGRMSSVSSPARVAG